MAQATESANGDAELVYVATTAPTVPSSKDDAAYKIVGLQTSFTYTLTGSERSERTKLGVEKAYGANTRGATLGANSSRVPDDGQTILNNAAEAEGAVKSDVWVLITTGVPDEKFMHFKCKVGNRTKGAPVNAASTAEWTLGINGAPTEGVLS